MATQTEPTTWQRLWRSPWTYVVLFLISLYDVDVDHGWQLAVSYVLLILWAVQFWKRANERWGQP